MPKFLFLTLPPLLLSRLLSNRPPNITTPMSNKHLKHMSKAQFLIPPPKACSSPHCPPIPVGGASNHPAWAPILRVILDSSLSLPPSLTASRNLINSTSKMCSKMWPMSLPPTTAFCIHSCPLQSIVHAAARVGFCNRKQDHVDSSLPPISLRIKSVLFLMDCEYPPPPWSDLCRLFNPTSYHVSLPNDFPATGVLTLHISSSHPYFLFSLSGTLSFQTLVYHHPDLCSNVTSLRSQTWQP